MSLVIRYNPATQPLCSLICSSIVNSEARANAKIKVVPAKDVPTIRLHLTDGKVFESSDMAVSRLIARMFGDFELYGTSPLTATQIDHFIDIALNDLINGPPSRRSFILNELNSHLTLRTFFAGRSVTLADIALWSAIGRTSSTPFTDVCNATQHPHLARWWTFLLAQQPVLLPIEELKLLAPAAKGDGQAAAAGGARGKEGGRKEGEKKENGKNDKAKEDQPNTGSAQYEGRLPNAEMGKVVTRFPPEPSGFLHIGHAKAALLNNYFARYYQGKLIVRFDDTNPAKEKEEFELAIIEDLKTLNIVGDLVSHTSDHFDMLQKMCEKLIKEGKAYVDFTERERLKQERADGVDSQCRGHSIEENLRLWGEMLKGSEMGCKCVVRAKIDMQSKIANMRDPTLYRCNIDNPHHRTGTKYKAYPMYDFACPIVDAVEGVTHAMRSAEYSDREEQYKWVLNACGLRDITIYAYSRLNFVNTVLSKRKLQWFVDQGFVESWADPRLATVQGIMRRGLRVEALMEFILEQGPSKSMNLMEWDKLWAKNKQFLDPIVPRYMAVNEGAAIVRLSDGPAEVVAKSRALHQKNEALGEAVQLFSKEILLEQDDAKLCEEGEEVTLMRWGNCVLDEIHKDGQGNVVSIDAHLNLSGDFKTTKKKLHWVPYLPDRLTPAILREFDHIINKKKPEEDDKMEDLVVRDSQFDTLALGDPLLKKLQEGDCIQLERRGYFRVDSIYWPSKRALVLIKIPDGKSKSMSTVSTKLDPSAVAKGGRAAGIFANGNGSTAQPATPAPTPAANKANGPKPGSPKPKSPKSPRSPKKK